MHPKEIDATTFVVSRTEPARTVGRVDARSFQKVALCAAQVRAQWVYGTLKMSNKVHPLSPTKIRDLRHSAASIRT